MLYTDRESERETEAAFVYEHTLIAVRDVKSRPLFTVLSFKLALRKNDRQSVSQSVGRTKALLLFFCSRFAATISIFRLPISFFDSKLFINCFLQFFILFSWSSPDTEPIEIKRSNPFFLLVYFYFNFVKIYSRAENFHFIVKIESDVSDFHSVRSVVSVNCLCPCL